MSGCIAVINAGSSSVKFALYDGRDELALRFRGQVEGIGVAPHLKVVDAEGIAVAKDNWPAEGFGHDQATRQLMRTGVGLIEGSQIIGIGHRVVHGGPHRARPIRVDHALLASLSELIPLAPLHQPHNLAPIKTLMEIVPLIPQVACFDTAFHRTQAPVAQSFALPDTSPKQVSNAMGFMAYPTNIS
jgi:acetate kinase